MKSLHSYGSDKFNVYLGGRPYITCLYCGLWAWKSDDSNGVFGTATKLAGTPGFQSPEQLKGENVTVSTDIYALGAIVTELFGGKPLWENVSSYAIMCQVSVNPMVGVDAFTHHARLH